MLEEKESKLLIKMSSETLEKMVWSPENTSGREENFQKMVSSRQSASETSDWHRAYSSFFLFSFSKVLISFVVIAPHAIPIRRDWGAAAWAASPWRHFRWKYAVRKTSRQLMPTAPIEMNDKPRSKGGRGLQNFREFCGFVWQFVSGTNHLMWSMLPFGGLVRL
jgi:hypothetical protein